LLVAVRGAEALTAARTGAVGLTVLPGELVGEPALLGVLLRDDDALVCHALLEAVEISGPGRVRVDPRLEVVPPDVRTLVPPPLIARGRVVRAGVRLHVRDVVETAPFEQHLVERPARRDDVPLGLVQRVAGGPHRPVAQPRRPMTHVRRRDVSVPEPG